MANGEVVGGQVCMNFVVELSYLEVVSMSVSRFTVNFNFSYLKNHYDQVSSIANFVSVVWI